MGLVHKQGSQNGERKYCTYQRGTLKRALGHNHLISTKISKNYSKVFYEVLKLWKLGCHKFESVKLLELHITIYCAQLTDIDITNR